jgi:ATP-dependent DNA helicase RecG
MFDEMRLAGLVDPLYEETAASVKLTLLGEPVDRQLEERLPRRSRAIMAALREADRLSTGEVAEKVGMSRPTASKHLRALLQANLTCYPTNGTRQQQRRTDSEKAHILRAFP